jgi:hypothetical protein
MTLIDRSAMEMPVELHFSQADDSVVGSGTTAELSAWEK